MALIDKNILERVIGNVIQKGSFSSGRVLPFEDTAVINWLTPEVGAELMAKITLYRADELAADMGGDYVAEDWAALWALMERVIAWGCYYEYLPFSVGTDSGNGLTEDVSEGSKPVRLGVLDKRQKATQVLLGKEIDRMMAYLFRNRDKYVAWRDSDTAQAMLELYVRSGVELGKALPESFGSWWLYKRMKVELQNRSEEVLVPVMQQGLYDAVVVLLVAGDDLTDPYKELRHLAANYVANYLYLQILPTLDVVLTEDGALRAVSDFDGINNRKQPTNDQLDRLYAGKEMDVNRHRGKLVAFIEANKDELTEWVEPELTDEEVEKNLLLPFQRNRERKRVFGV